MSFAYSASLLPQLSPELQVWLKIQPKHPQAALDGLLVLYAWCPAPHEAFVPVLLYEAPQADICAVLEEAFQFYCQDTGWRPPIVSVLAPMLNNPSHTRLYI